MRKVISLALAFGITLGFAATATAQQGGRCGRPRHGVNQRQNRQQNRIGQGIRSGELTRRETFRLEREQYSIRREERQARRDGELTPQERAELQRELNQASRHIYRAKHNEKDRN